jgi:hypothetical protein
MNLKNKIQQIISKKIKTKRNTKSLKSTSTTKSSTNAFWAERFPLFAALFFFAFGMGLISDGKKMYSHQLKLSQRVDYKATLNPYN